MDVTKKEDVLLLANEEFDFDLSLSSSSANEDDEVFFGPVGHKERCIAASLELNDRVPAPPASASASASASACDWSPLTAEKFVEVYKEAHLLALQIESQSRTQATPAAQPEKPGSQAMESFIQESKLKMSLFEKEQETEKSPRSLKRETYCLSDSPLVGTPLLGGQPASAEPLHPAPAPAPASPAPRGPGPAQRLQPLAQALPRDPQPAHPPGQARPQKRVLSKLPLPRVLATRGRHLYLAAEKPKKEAPASPSQGKVLSQRQPHSAGFPDRRRAARDAAGSLGGHGARSLPVPSKVGLKKGLGKPAGCAGSATRRSCSSSSSRSSSGSASASACSSPVADKGGSPNGVTPKFSRAQRLQSWASAGRAVVHSTPVRRSSGPASQSPSGSTRTPVSARRMSTLPTPASRRLSGLPLMTPRTVPRALVPPLCTPARQLSSEPRRRSTVGTEPARDSGPGQVAPSPGDGFSPPPPVPQALCFSPEKSDPFSEGPVTGPAQDEAKPKEDTHPAEVADTAVPDCPPLRIPAQTLLVDLGLDQLTISPWAESRPLADLLLIDLGGTPGADVPSGPASGPLIDLTTNTPDMSRHGESKALQPEGQLIDLCSPLIQLSPEADKENLDSPLLKF
ncbi:PREDICTED: G2 and S phase-expressed protein 1 isoform X3 [Chinchilla lanigera]|uniref:G2 and S phase-expressed protein 1 isoform X3 n=1 Tax=Chinchilla lanigera TaxID=34839 RepID=UPI00038EC4CA|nr:PREDICTED: G2 and S phase-expressed protein 1 isoform X3 [Chinchilla lanigera]